MNDEEKNRARVQVEMFLDHLERFGISVNDLLEMKRHLKRITGWQSWVWSLVKMVLVVLMWEGLQQITGWFN